MRLGRWQPDFMAISCSNKKIAIVPEVCQPSDTRAKTVVESLLETYGRKLQMYKSVQTALQKYTASGWKARVLLWVVGAESISVM